MGIQNEASTRRELLQAKETLEQEIRSVAEAIETMKLDLEALILLRALTH